ncbi:hypothetical protein ACFV6Y_38300 [Streptomyces massasporeus]|uniref:hypothetical protein n=1 Tax=Streptomyces massasporeus TaxID=67324 RepID=UPI003652E624
MAEGEGGSTPRRPTPSRAERAKRDAQVLQLWLAGHSYRAIGDSLGMSHTNVDKVVRREMAKAEKRRDALADEALGVFIERSEALFAAHFKHALKGDYRSSVICDRVMARQARLYGLMGDGGSGAGRRPIEPDEPDGPLDEGEADSDEVVTKLDGWRRRSGGA